MESRSSFTVAAMKRSRALQRALDCDAPLYVECTARGWAVRARYPNAGVTVTYADTEYAAHMTLNDIRSAIAAGEIGGAR